MAAAMTTAPKTAPYVATAAVLALSIVGVENSGSVVEFVTGAVGTATGAASGTSTGGSTGAWATMVPSKTAKIKNNSEVLIMFFKAD